MFLKFIRNCFNNSIFKIFNYFDHFWRVFLIDNNIFKESLYKCTHNLFDFSFYCPLLVYNPLLVCFISLLFLFELLKFRCVKFVNIFEFLLKIFTFFIHFGNGSACNLNLIGKSTILRLFGSDCICKSFDLISEFLNLLSFESKELKPIFLKFFYFFLKGLFHWWFF